MTPTDQLHTAKAGHRGKLAAILAACGVLIIIVVFVTPRTAQVPRGPSAEPANPSQILEAVEQQRAALAEVTLRSLRDDAAQVLRGIERVVQLRTQWDRDVQALLDNDSGRQLGADADRVRRFAALLHVSLPEPEVLAAQQARMEALVTPIGNALSGKLAMFSPDDQFRRQIDAEGQRVREQERALADNARMLAAIVSEVSDSASAPADEPLRVKVDRYEREVAATRLRTIQEAQAEVERQETARLAELRAQEARDDAARKERELEAELRRKRAADPTIQARYRPFLTKGRFIFNTARNWSYIGNPGPDFGDIPAPASLRRLKSIGALNNEFVFWATGAGLQPSESVAKKYGYHGQGYGNDRHTWGGWPRTEEEHKMIKEQFQEFQELAPLWIEMGLLKP